MAVSSQRQISLRSTLGDAFALGTAAHVDGMLLVGAAGDYDDITEVQITRFRIEPA
ncbi:hypothetical protein C468_16792 [Halorubrum kocurii JCM 14978]|uniref:Uncharacterized protein n=1 Tax=Halorubrum kocurii JCM 14978 TaxID=1230456 RepID=M0NI73_9EURY|nr:hypothetical protein C468_16792 [Halorubrum kocurii JCM 14978]